MKSRVALALLFGVLALAPVVLVPGIGSAKDIETTAWSEVAASNTAAVPDGFPDNIAPSQVKAILREVMAALKRDWDRSHGTIASTGSANAYALTYAAAPVAYANGQRFTFLASFANTGAATANVNGLGALPIQKQTGSGLANLASGDIQPGQHVELEYDAGIGALVLLDPQAGAITTPVSVTNGGTGLSAVSADQVPTGTAANSYTAKTIPDCQDSAGNHLNYVQSSHAWSCGSGTSGAVLGSTNSFTAVQHGPTCSLTDAASIAWSANSCQIATVTIAGNRTLSNPTSPISGSFYTLKIVQGSGGSHSLAYGANFAWPGGIAPTLSTAAGAYDIETFYYDGTKMNGVANFNFQ